jgi:hypothetical protein
MGLNPSGMSKYQNPNHKPVPDLIRNNVQFRMTKYFLWLFFFGILIIFIFISSLYNCGLLIKLNSINKIKEIE